MFAGQPGPAAAPAPAPAKKAVSRAAVPSCPAGPDALTCRPNRLTPPPLPRQAGGVYSTDYSKWDNLEVSDSEEEEDDDEGEGWNPGFGGADEEDAEELVTPGAEAMANRPGLGFGASDGGGAAAGSSGKGSGGSKLLEAAKAWASAGGEAAEAGGAVGAPAATAAVPAVPAVPAAPVTQLARLTRNGGDTGRYLWSQDKAECVVAVRAPAGARAKDVTVEVEENGEALRVRPRQHLHCSLCRGPL